MRGLWEDYEKMSTWERVVLTYFHLYVHVHSHVRRRWVYTVNNNKKNPENWEWTLTSTVTSRYWYRYPLWLLGNFKQLTSNRYTGPSLFELSKALLGTWTSWTPYRGNHGPQQRVAARAEGIADYLLGSRTTDTYYTSPAATLCYYSSTIRTRCPVRKPTAYATLLVQLTN